jgi:hypothetical protein
MSSTVMADRCPGATALGPARLDDHRLGFRLPSLRWGGYAADIVNDDGVTTWGVLWKLSEEHLESQRAARRGDDLPGQAGVGCARRRITDV